MKTPEYLDAVVDQTATLAACVGGQDPAAPVPTCPDWALADLVDHVGAVQRMTTMLVGERLTDPTSAFERQAAAPDDPALWSDWLVAGAAEAQQAFAAAHDETPVWEPSGAQAGVPFWSRRLFGEISVHRADAAVALDRRYELHPDHAAAALEDWLDTLTSPGYWENRPGFAEAMRGHGETLHLHATDADGEWLARREQDEVVLVRTHADADVVASGPATELLLAISRRRPLAECRGIDVQGDRALLEHWIDHMDWVTG